MARPRTRTGRRGRDRHPFAGARVIFRREMPSRLEERGAVIEQVLRTLEAEGCHPDSYFDRLSLDEAISNAIIHGNRSDRSKRVTVSAFRSGDRWGYEVSDQGSGFPWREQLQKLRRGLDQARESGRGLALILALGAKVSFLDGGRRVVVVRREPGA